MPSEQLDILIGMLTEREHDLTAPVEQVRAAFDEETSAFPIEDDVTSEPVEMGGVPAEWVTVPDSSEDRVIFYLHGGGYAIGSPRTHRAMISRIARASGARALSVDYRLAPENPHPAALEDSLAAYRALLSQGVDPARIVIGGDSAGGGLALATLVSLRDAGEPLPAAAVFLSPWTDLAGTGESMETKAQADPMITGQGLADMAAGYAGGAKLANPLISPLYADLNGLPPMLIQVGTAEMLLDDSARLAARAREAGVEVAYEPWEDMIHVWQFFAWMLPEGQQAIDRIGEYIRAIY
jgi:monoterpene epsilon-lactone hydrolase